MNEERFLETLFRRLPRPPGELVVGPGDDCAAIADRDNQLLLIALDQLIGGRHYANENNHANQLEPTPPEAVGRKLLTRNLSDIAAMGGTPTFCLTGFAVSPRHRDRSDWLRRVFEGLLQTAAEYRVHLIGGDLAATDRDDVGSLTILGTVPVAQVCRRTGADPCDLLFATGCFGDSLASGHHLDFSPRLPEGRWLARQGIAKAMIDVSDGLLLDSLRLARASRLAIEMELAAVPLRNPQRPPETAAGDGEDYELLFAVAPQRAPELVERWPFPDTPLTRIGSFQANQKPDILDRRGKSLTTARRLGYDHYRETCGNHAASQ